MNTSPIFIVLILLVLLVVGRCFIRTGKIWSRLFALLLLLNLLVVEFYFVADYFTNEGVNDVVFYHIAYGMEGAGFGEYAMLIVVSIFAIVGSVLLSLFFGLRKITEPRSPSYMAGIVCGGLIVVLFFNPATQATYNSLFRNVSSSSDFYNYYRIPTIKEGASRKKNLLFIYAESLERTYFDETLFPGLITHLRDFEAESLFFTDIRQLSNTDFTIAGMVASQSGIPLFADSGSNSMGGVDDFLPGAKSLGDLLHQKGFYLSYYGGANLIFAGKGKYFNSHGFDEVKGYVELIHSTEDTSYHSHWGLFDDTLLDLAFGRFVELSETKKRFGMFLLTMDTHHPNGHLSKGTEHIKYGDGANPILNAVAGSDYLLGKFIKRVRQSEYGKDTVIVVMSDHLALRNTATSILKTGQRRNMFMISDPDRKAVSSQVNVRGSTLDIGPTVLPFLGYEANVGLGRNLLDPSLDEKEIAHIGSKKTLLGWKHDILQFWGFPKLEKGIEVEVGNKTVKVDDRTFSLPILIELGPNYETILKFEFFSELTLKKHVEKMPAAKKYILIENENGWTLTLGRGSEVIKTIELGEYLRLNKDGLESYFNNQNN